MLPLPSKTSNLLPSFYPKPIKSLADTTSATLLKTCFTCLIILLAILHWLLPNISVCYQCWALKTQLQLISKSWNHIYSTRISPEVLLSPYPRKNPQCSHLLWRGEYYSAAQTPHHLKDTTVIVFENYPQCVAAYSTNSFEIFNCHKVFNVHTGPPYLLHLFTKSRYLIHYPRIKGEHYYIPPSPQVISLQISLNI